MPQDLDFFDKCAAAIRASNRRPWQNPVLFFFFFQDLAIESPATACALQFFDYHHTLPSFLFPW